MKVLALVASPRKGSNTDILVDRVLAGARSKGRDCEKVYLYPMRIEGCVDCRKCKRREHVCPVKDDMQELYPKLETADVIVFGTPLYWYGPTGKMKLLIDRLRPFIASRRLGGKSGVLVTPSEEGETACGPLVEMFRMSFGYLGMRFAGALLAVAYERAEINDKPEELQRAERLGACL
jgi:multimeric flavodoxin WrbA